MLELDIAGQSDWAKKFAPAVSLMLLPPLIWEGTCFMPDGDSVRLSQATYSLLVICAYSMAVVFALLVLWGVFYSRRTWIAWLLGIYEALARFVKNIPTSWRHWSYLGNVGLKKFAGKTWLVNSIQVVTATSTACILVTKLGFAEENQAIIELKQFLNDHVVASGIVIFFAVLGLFFPIIINIARERSKNLGDLHGAGIGFLLEAIILASKKKSHRISKCLELIEKDGPWVSSQTFANVAKPDDQLREFLSCLAIFFEKLVDEKKEVEVVLVSMGSTYVRDYVAYCPPDKKPIASIDDLKYDDVTFTIARETGDIVVIRDIKSECQQPDGVRRFRKIKGGKNHGSMFCYPIRPAGGSDIPLVLSVRVDQIDFFSELRAEVQKWKKICERIEPFIAIEWNLRETMELTDFMEGGATYVKS